MKRISLPSWACPRRLILASSGLLLLITGQVVVFRALAPVQGDEGAQVVAQIEPSSAPDEAFEDRDFKQLKVQSDISYAPQTGLALDKISLPHSVPVVSEAPKAAAKPIQVKKASSGKGARIAIVIDDMGVNKKMSAEALATLPAEITLSYLPYASDVQAGIDAANAKGHEVILHIPMQPLSASENAGPVALRVSMNAAEIRETLEGMIGDLHGFTGMNNHMGSRFTGDLTAMNAFMDVVSDKKAYFLDSRTIGASKGAEAAAVNRVAFASRDVFLDHKEDRSAVEAQLAALERAALKKGSAIAIGHPKDNTLAALKAWIPDAKARGFEIVPLKKLVRDLPDPQQTTAFVTSPDNVTPQ